MHSSEQSTDRQNRDGGNERSAFSGLSAEAGLLSLAAMPGTDVKALAPVSKVELGPDGKPIVPDDQKGFGLRDQMSLASVCFCSPFMLFGLGAAMAAYDGFKANNTDNTVGRGRFTRGSGNLYAPGYSRYAQEKADEAFNRMISRRPVSTYADSTVRGKSEPKKQERVQNSFSQSRVAYAETRFRQKQANDMLAARRIVKEKTKLEADMERVKKTQNYSLSCQLSSRLELLDKTLKRMGM